MRYIGEQLKYPFEGDTDLNDAIFKDAIESIFDTENINLEYDIPYLASSSMDGKTIYIDRHFPLMLKYMGTLYSLIKPIALHERVEKSLMDTTKLVYQEAHQIALRVELEYVKMMGLDVNVYIDFCDKYIKKSFSEKLEKVPADLYLKPEEDEKDQEKIRGIMSANKEIK